MGGGVGREPLIQNTAALYTPLCYPNQWLFGFGENWSFWKLLPKLLKIQEWVVWQDGAKFLSIGSIVKIGPTQPLYLLFRPEKANFGQKASIKLFFQKVQQKWTRP